MTAADDGRGAMEQRTSGDVAASGPPSPVWCATLPVWCATFPAVVCNIPGVVCNIPRCGVQHSLCGVQHPRRRTSEWFEWCGRDVGAVWIDNGVDESKPTVACCRASSVEQRVCERRVVSVAWQPMLSPCLRQAVRAQIIYRQ